MQRVLALRAFCYRNIAHTASLSQVHPAPEGLFYPEQKNNLKINEIKCLVDKVKRPVVKMSGLELSF